MAKCNVKVCFKPNVVCDATTNFGGIETYEQNGGVESERRIE
jgi:hypothetical protein